MSGGGVRPLNPPVWVLALASFTVGLSMRMLDPLLPMLAREFGVGLGGVAPLIGGFALAYGLGQIALGPLGDRFGKMRVAALALTFYTGTLFGAAMAEGLTTLLAFRVLAGLATAAVVPLFMAHIGDNVPYGQRQAVLGKLLNGMVAAQLLAGPMAGAVAEFAGWRVVFWGVGVMAAAATAFFAYRLGPAVWRAPPASAGGSGMSGFLRILEKRAGRRLMLGTALDGLLLFGGAIPFIASLLIERFSMTAAGASFVPGPVTTPMVPYRSQGSQPPAGQSRLTCMVMRANSPPAGNDACVDTSRLFSSEEY